MILRPHRLDVTRLAADYSAAVRAAWPGIARAMAEQWGGLATRARATVTPITGEQMALAF